jgi:hypothetical protein
MALLNVTVSSSNSLPVSKPVEAQLNQTKNLSLDKTKQLDGLAMPELAASGSLNSVVDKDQLKLVNNTGGKLAFLENPVSEVVKTLEMLKTGGQNNIVPFLRKVIDSPMPNAQKKWLIQQAVNMVGGAKNFVRIIAPFAKALGPFLTKVNLALLPLAVYEEVNAWLNTPVADGTLPQRMRGKPEPAPVNISTTNPTNPKTPSYPTTVTPKTQTQTQTQTQLNKPQPKPIPYTPALPLAPTKPSVDFPTPTQQKAELNLKSTEMDVSMAKYWVDQDFSKIPVLGVTSFKENVAKLFVAVRAYDQAVAAAQAAGVRNLKSLLNSFVSTATQARDLLSRAPQREVQISSAEQKAAADPSRLSGRKLDFNNPASVSSAINYESMQSFLTNAGGIKGLVEKGLIKQPEDFFKLFGQKTFLPEELKIFSNSLRNFIAKPGVTSTALVKAAQFLYDNIRAFRDPNVTFDFPSAEVLKQAGKPRAIRSNSETPNTIPDPWKTPPEANPFTLPKPTTLSNFPDPWETPLENSAPGADQTSDGGNTPTNPPNGGGGSAGGSGRSGGPTGGSNPGNNPLPPGNKLSRFIATVIATKEGKELLGQTLLNGFQALGVATYNAWPSVRTGPAIKNAHDEIISFLKNPSDYNKANYNEIVKGRYFPPNNSGQILFDGVNKQLMTRLPPDLYDAALQNAKELGYSSPANAKEGYWLDSKSNELKMNILVSGKVMPIVLRPPAFQDKKTENFKFDLLKWQDAKVVVPQPGYALKQGQLTIMSMQLGPSDGLHYKFYFGIDTERAITPLRFEAFAAKGPKDKVPALVGRAFEQQNIATVLATGTTQHGGSKFGDAVNPNQGNTSFSTLAVAQLVDRNTLGQIVYDHNKNYGEVATKRAWVFEVDIGGRLDFTKADGTKFSGMVVDEWAAGNITWYKVKLGGDGKAFKEAFQNLKNKNVWPPKIETLVKDPDAKKFKATTVKVGYGVLGAEGASIEWDGQSWVGIVRMERPARNPADRPTVVPPELRIGTDAKGNPVVEPWPPSAGAKPTQPQKLNPTNNTPKNQSAPVIPAVQQQPQPSGKPTSNGKPPLN